MIKKTWDQWNKYGNPHSADFINKVCPIPPILFVGDRNKYENSKIKVITVALNPSKNGAVKEIHEKEFPRWKGIGVSILRDQSNEYLKGLEEYFCKDPARNYFQAFEPILNGMETSFYAPREGCNQIFRNCALHTDLCSQLTTDPNWGDLYRINPNIQKNLAEASSGLWNELVRHLKPNLILASFGKEHLKWIKLLPLDMNKSVENTSTWEKTFKIGEKPYIANGITLNIGKIGVKQPQNAFFVLGQGSRRPFMIKDEYKYKLGVQILNYMKESGLINPEN